MPRPPSVLSTRCAQSYEHGGGWSGGQWDSGEEMGNRPPGYRRWVFLMPDLFSLRFSSPPLTGPASLEFSGRTRCSLTTTSLASQTLVLSGEGRQTLESLPARCLVSRGYGRSCRLRGTVQLVLFGLNCVRKPLNSLVI